MSTPKTRAATQALVEAAILIALATILSLIKIYEMPWGGSVTLVSLLPLVIISYRHGIKWGILSALVYSILQIFLGFGTVSAAFLPGDDQMIWYKAILMVLLDYVFAFSLVGFSGIFRKKRKLSAALCLGSLIGTGARYVMHFLSGLILWGSYANWFFEELDQTVGGSLGSGILGSFSGTGLAAVYSLIYNGCYMIPEMIITAIAAYLIGRIPAIANRISVSTLE